jgi:Ca-activated chloride channel family protein
VSAVDATIARLAALGQTPGIDGFERAWLLVLLAPLALLPVASAWRTRGPAVPWPAFAEARAAGASRREPRRWLDAGMRSAALLCLAAVMAGPFALREHAPPSGLGLDLVLAVDASGSMGAIDAGGGAGGGAVRTRLDVAREAVARFARERSFAGDRVGLIVFGESAFTQCPLTHDAALLGEALGRVAVGVAGDATALGDALALAVKRVLAAPDTARDARAVVLLTDGRSNAGQVPIGVATALAAAESVRVHTVAIGRGGGEVAVETASGIRFERHEPDLHALRTIAERTGGRFFVVHGAGDLLAVYAAIDALERGPRTLPARRRVEPRPEPLLAGAAGLLFAELLIGRALGRTLP